MAIFDRIKSYSIMVFHNDFPFGDRQIALSLESGGKATIFFPAQRPADWLQFVGSSTNLFLTAADYDALYHLVQSERPVFFTALNLAGLRVGAVHTELDLSAGEPPGEGDEDRSLVAMLRRAVAQDPTLLPRPRRGRRTPARGRRATRRPRR
jgi:hypothetical protein